MGNYKHIGKVGRTAIIVFLCVVLLPSCSLFRKYFEKVVVEKEVVTKDTIIYRDRIVHDTAHVEIPVYIEVNVTKDDSSHLENPFAVSDAWVKDGLLYHSLKTKPQTIDAPIDVHVTDTTSSHYEKRDSTAIKEVYMEKPLSAIQKAKIGAFWWLLGGLALALLWIFRKPILSLLKTII